MISKIEKIVEKTPYHKKYFVKKRIQAFFFVSILYLQMTYKILQKNANNFYCENCDFVTSNKYNFNKHLNTRKHKILTNTYKNLAKNATCD